VTRIDTGSSDVNFLAVDNGLAVTNVHCPLSTDKVCGYTRDASARVFHLPSGRALHSLNCAPAGPAPLDPRVMRPVQLSLGRNIIATVVDVEHEAAVMTGEAGGGDVVSVWDRTDGRLLYQVHGRPSLPCSLSSAQGRPHGPGVSVLGLAVQGDAVLTGGGTGRLARVEEGPEGWAAGHLLEGSGQEVTHLECDGRSGGGLSGPLVQQVGGGGQPAGGAPLGPRRRGGGRTREARHGQGLGPRCRVLDWPGVDARPKLPAHLHRGGRRLVRAAGGNPL
jgi:hypothetical protein